VVSLRPRDWHRDGNPEDRDEEEGGTGRSRRGLNEATYSGALTAGRGRLGRFRSALGLAMESPRERRQQRVRREGLGQVFADTRGNEPRNFAPEWHNRQIV